MKKLLGILLLILVTACGNSGTKTRYYPGGEKPASEDVVEIHLDTSRFKFWEIIEQIGTVQNRGEMAVVQFTDGEILKRIIPVLSTGEGIHAENKLIIRSETIIREQVYPVNRLNPVLRQHYTTTFGDPGSPVEAIVVIAVDPERTAAELRQVLRNLTRSFDDINGEVEEDLKLHVLFDYFSPTPPPPPPPLPAEK